MPPIRSIQQQRGLAVIVIVLIVAVVIAILVAVAIGTSAPTTPGTPPPACFPAATQCRVFIQNEVSCCGGVPVVGQRIGWCVGWWDAMPCRGGPAGQGQLESDQRVRLADGDDGRVTQSSALNNPFSFIAGEARHF